ncbi:olfactomedin-like isoform X2 [Hemicordylus capensis]|nr:olfactomedin-like isoform X2 [Hemicordylus capensis]
MPIAREGNNECVCSIELPDDVFPQHMIDFLKESHTNMTHIIDQELDKITKINDTMKVFEDRVKNLTEKIRDMEMNGIKDQTDYTNTKNLIDNLNQLSKDLHSKLNGTDTDIEHLLTEVNNISSIVWQLESFDTNSVLATHRELATIRKQLADCEEAAGNPNFGLPSAGLLAPEFGKCDKKVLVNISKPFIVKLNWRGFNYRYGAWGKDFAVGAKNPDLFWVAPLNTDERLMETYRLYNSYSDLLLYKNQVEKTLSQYIGLTWNYISCGQGSGTILYNGSLYYNCHNSRNLCKLDVATNKVKRKSLEDAAFNNWFSYSGINWQDFDFAGDEKGLWVMYSTESSKGKIVIGKLDPDNLKLLKTWETSAYKPNVTNTFMICGVMYALQRLSAHKEKLFYTYDTSTGKEGTTDIIMEKLSATPQSVSYNPNDHKIYMYNDGYLVTYDVLFKRLPRKERRSVANEDEQTALIAVSGGRQQFAMIQ